jgi:hypothetical protein
VGLEPCSESLEVDHVVVPCSVLFGPGWAYTEVIVGPAGVLHRPGHINRSGTLTQMSDRPPGALREADRP